MRQIQFNKQILPHFIAIIVFLLVVIIFYHPAFFEGKQLSQYDILMAKGPAKALEDYREETGKEGLWALNIFSGMPAYLVNINWNGDFFRFLYHLSYLELPSPARLTFPAMLSFYILLLAFGVRPYLAIGGAIAFSLTSFNIISISVGHNLKVLALAYAPLVIAGVHLVFRNKIILGFIITLIGLYLQIRVNHLQITYYLMLILVFYGIFQFYNAYRNRLLKEFFQSVLILLIPLILAVGINAGKLWSVYSYSKYSIRGPSELTTTENNETDGLSKEYAFRYSYSIFEPITLLIPNFFGGPSTQKLDRDSEIGKALRRNNVTPGQSSEFLGNVRTYWGKQPYVEGPFYAGAIIIFLFILGIVFSNGTIKYWLIGITVLGVILSWGKNFSSFNYLLFEYLPGYNKFRSVTFTIMMSLISMPLLGFIGLNNLIDEPDKNKKALKLLKAVLIAAGSCLFILIISGFINYRSPVDTQYPEWIATALREDRKDLLQNDTMRALIFILLIAFSIYLYIKKKISLNILTIIAILLVIIDLWSVDRRYLKTEDFQRNPVKNYFTPNDADKSILIDKGDYRVLNFINPFNDGRTSYFHQSIGGYHGAKLRRYQELIEKPLSNDISSAISKIQDSNLNFKDNDILNMLNTKYLIAGSARNSVLENPDTNGSAWFIENIIEVNSADDEYKMVEEINTKKEAVVDISKFSLTENEYDTTGRIELIEKLPDRLKYSCINDKTAFVVFSEIFYPEGWSAKINGEKTDILRVNYVLRGLEIPPGENMIEFFFKPVEYYAGNLIMKISSVASYLIVAGLIILGLYRKNRLDNK